MVSSSTIRAAGAIYHAWVLFMLGTFLALLVTNLRRLRRLEDEPPLDVSGPPLISVLIPARDEAGSLPRCLDSLLDQDYPRFDVTVLDDGSTDGSSDLAKRYARAETRIRLISGEPLPGGWAGKPWACHQLAQQAAGEILVFVDADTWYEPDVLSRAAGLMQREQPALLSLMPRQVTETFVERVVVPGLYMAFLCGVPLWRIDDSRYSEVAAANGQFMCFDAEAYGSTGGHEAVKDQIIEDIAFARLIKRSGYKVNARTAVDTVHCRMYRSWREVLDGFSKNAYSALGERPLLAARSVSNVLAVFVLP